MLQAGAPGLGARYRAPTTAAGAEEIKGECASSIRQVNAGRGFRWIHRREVMPAQRFSNKISITNLFSCPYDYVGESKSRGRREKMMSFGALKKKNPHIFLPENKAPAGTRSNACGMRCHVANRLTFMITIQTGMYTL